MHFFNENKDPNDISIFIIQIIIIAILGVPIAILDIKFEKYRKDNNLNTFNKLFIILLQLLLGIIYIYILFKTIPTITSTFQKTLPGLYFAGMFYSLQYNLFTSLQDIIKKSIE